ncbi:MAG: sulfurtransferase TusA family protein [Pseudomonadota bacterium]|nr:sulfurtransferase TusA family protein [Pseudomonadota bacterium]MDO7667444.1 sulfurtransferase TusA family protein [Pseudomonadota bacterium]MDO7711529.1 sulfurtransferase TusA family protein [Pseudomonadota bacterium]
MSGYELDARRMLCPMPVIKTQNKVKELAVGDILSVICTDPGVLSDIPAWARINGHTILGHQDNGDEITIIVMVGS